MEGVGVGKYDPWEKVADLNVAREIVLTGWGSKTDKLPSDDWLFDQFNGWGGRVLDFGCGVGRNIVALSKRNHEVVGFDFPSMIQLLGKEKGSLPSNVRLETDWEKVKAERFDVTVATLVFQHIHQADLWLYLEDLISMTRSICIHSRVRDDFAGPRIPDILRPRWKFAKVFYPANGTLDDVLRMGPEDHFSAKLEPKAGG